MAIFIALALILSIPMAIIKVKAGIKQIKYLLKIIDSLVYYFIIGSNIGKKNHENNTNELKISLFSSIEFVSYLISFSLKTFIKK